MKRFFLTLGLVCFCFYGFSLNARFQVREEVVVSANRVKEKKKDVAKNVKIITKKDIEKMAAETAADVLANIPGVIVSSNGGYGSLTSIYLRGASPSHTIIMVDGIEINDPMSPTRSADISSILASDIEKVEVVYGSESAVYGSDAMAGVVNIITVTNRKKLNVFFEGGSKSTTHTGVNLQNRQGNLFYYAKGFFFDTDGISAADRSFGNTEKDGYTNATFSGGIKYRFDKSEVSTSLMYINIDNDLDNFGGQYGDSPSFEADREDYYGKFEWKYLNPFGLDGYSKFLYNYTSVDRNYDNDNKNFPPIVNSNYRGEFDKFTLFNLLNLGKNSNISFGIEHSEEKGHSYYYTETNWGPYESVFKKKSVNTDSVFVNFVKAFSKVTVNAGLRYDDHDEFGSKTTFNAGFVVPITTTLDFKINGGTGFKAPSLFQLYSSFGNTDLNAEKSDSFEGFFEKRLVEGKLILTAGYFYNKYKDLIYFDMKTYKYANGQNAETKGVETTIRYNGKVFNWHFGFTNISYSADQPSYFYNRPESTMNFGLSYTHFKWQFNISALYYDDRTSFDYLNFKEVKLDSFTVVDLRINYRFNRKFTFYVKGHNIFDEDYEYVYGYGTLGAVYYAGVRYSLY